MSVTIDTENTINGGSTGDAAVALRVALDMARSTRADEPTPPAVAVPLILLSVAVAAGILAADLLGRAWR